MGDESEARLLFSAAEEEALRKQRGMTARLLGNLLHRNNLIIWVPLAVWLLQRSMAHGVGAPPTRWPLGLLTVYLLWYTWATIPSLLYDLVLEAQVWKRWDAALRYTERLSTWTRRFKLPMPNHELLFRTATAEAGMGRLDAALARLAPLETDDSLRPGYYHARLADVYFAAGDFARVALVQHEARKRAPSDSASIDLAATMARRLGNYRAARILIAEVDEQQQPPLARAFLHSCRGLIALDAGEVDEAAQQFARSLAIMRAYVGMPLVKAVVADTGAHYALALAALGKTEDAALHLAAARPILSARGEHALLQRCDAALRAQH